MLPMGSYSPHKSRATSASQQSTVQLAQSAEYGHPCRVHASCEVTIQCVKCETGVCLQCAIGEHCSHPLLSLKGYQVGGNEPSVIDIEVLGNCVGVGMNDVGNLERRLVIHYANEKSAISKWRDDIVAMVTEKATKFINGLNTELSKKRQLFKEYESDLAAR